jgi:hypothetical protein
MVGQAVPPVLNAPAYSSGTKFGGADRHNSSDSRHLPYRLLYLLILGLKPEGSLTKTSEGCPCTNCGPPGI